MERKSENKLSTIGDRLRVAINFNGTTAYEVAYATGISQATLSRILSNKTQKPLMANIEKLAEYLYLNIEWLLTGNGNMMKVSDSLPFPELLAIEKKKLEHSQSKHLGRFEQLYKDFTDNLLTAIEYIKKLEDENVYLAGKNAELKSLLDKLKHRFNCDIDIPE